MFTFLHWEMMYTCMWQNAYVCGKFMSMWQLQKMYSLVCRCFFQYPPGKKLTMRSIDLYSFYFPRGVKAHVVERTLSLSDLYELVYGWEHLGNDTLAFISPLKDIKSMVLPFLSSKPEESPLKKFTGSY